MRKHSCCTKLDRLSIFPEPIKFRVTSRTAFDVMMRKVFRQFLFVQSTGHGYFGAKEEFHANFYSFVNPRTIEMQITPTAN